MMEPYGKEVRCYSQGVLRGQKYVMDTIFLELPLTIAQTARLFGGAKVFRQGRFGGILVRVGETKHGDKTSISYEALVFQNHELASEYISPNRVLESRP